MHATPHGELASVDDNHSHGHVALPALPTRMTTESTGDFFNEINEKTAHPSRKDAPAAPLFEKPERREPIISTKGDNTTKRKYEASFPFIGTYHGDVSLNKRSKRAIDGSTCRFGEQKVSEVVP